MTLQTGLARRKLETQLYMLGAHRYTESASLHTVVQPRPFMRDQRSKPSCVGQAWAGCIEAVTGERVSAVDLWEGARSMQGDAGESMLGTLGEYAWWWSLHHGWTDWVYGEDSRPERADEDYRIGQSLADAMQAHQKRRNRVQLVQTINMRQGTDAIAEQVVAALQSGLGVVREGSTTPEYMRGRFGDRVLGPEMFSGHQNGHAERIFAYDAGRSAFCVAGSWGSWTYCTIDGIDYPGCCWISRKALAQAWALDVIKVR